MAQIAARTGSGEARSASMAERVRSFDWSHTPLGPRPDWPQALHLAINLVMNARFPMCLAWGDSLISFCNDAYRPLLGSQPDALGRPFPEVCAEAWTVISPIVARAQAGESSYVEDLPLVLDRHGYPEHTWWTFSCSPVSDETGRVRGILCVGHETTGEVESRAAMPTQREQIARLFENAPGFMSYLSGPNHVFQLNKPHFRHAAEDRILGRSIREAYPELAGQGVFERLDEVYRSGKPLVETGLKMVFDDDAGEREYYFNLVYQPVRDDDGSVIGIFSVGQDVTDVVKAEAALREREERLRVALDAGRMAVFDVDVVAGVIAASPELNRMFGLPPDAVPSLDEVRAQFYPGELDRMRRVIREARQRGEAFFETEHRHIRADNGEIRWLLIRSLTTFAEDGAVRRAFGVIMDVTERKEAEERLKLLALEVDHRANNLLATVQSMVTLTRAEDIPGFRESVLGRIGALAHAHRLMAETRWTAAGLSRVVEEELRPFMAGSRVRVEGPDANLAPAVAQGVAMALHELATNAAKHGALSRREGRIEVTWTAPDDAGCVRMTWLERGGPAVSPPSRAGFGTNLLRRALAGSVGGAVELEWQAEGVCCRLHIPVALS